MTLSDFDYHLPSELIAQKPMEPRDHSRLMVINRATQEIIHDHFYNLTKYLGSSDLLIANQSKVIPARLYGRKEGGGKIEILLLPNNHFIGKNIGRARKLIFGNGLVGEIVGDVIDFNMKRQAVLAQGHVPLPPYIKQDDSLVNNYQTVYAKDEGSVAAPTAGFHFTPELLSKFDVRYVTLHVGIGTFMPVKTEKIEEHVMHSESYFFDPKIVSQGKRIVAIGTTSVRVLETWATTGKSVGETDIFIYPGYKFKTVDALITNFHQPKSTLLMLVSAFAGLELVKKAYLLAIQNHYRFHSFGDAMLIL